MLRGLIVSGLLLTAGAQDECAPQQNVKVAAPAAELDARFVLESTVVLDGVVRIRVFHDVKTGATLYVTPDAGVAVKEKD